MDTEQRRRSGQPRREPDPRKRKTAPQTDTRRRQSSGRDQTATRKRESGAGNRTGSSESTARRRPSEAEPAAARKRPKTGTGTREAERRPPRRRRTTSGSAPRRRRKRSEAQTPEIIYTPPKPFSRNRFLLHLATVVAVVLAVTFMFSIFFKVRTITVSGANLYTPWEIREASGIAEGDNLLTFGQVRAGAKIKAALPYVDTVRVGIKLPDTVNIEIVERDVVYAIQAQDNSWWLITADGIVVEQTNSAEAGNHTKVTGLRLAAPLSGQSAVAVEETTTPEPSDTGDPSNASEETTPVTVTGARRLEVALQILMALEENGFAGTAASVDVSNINSLVVWYSTRYEVRLGDTTSLDYKIQCMKDVIDRMSEYQSGTLDISFTTWENEVGYTPFD